MMGLVLDTDLLRDHALELLADVGLKVEHEELAREMVAGGCTLGPTGRVRVPAELIAELVAAQKQTRARDDDDQQLLPWCGPDWAHWIIWTRCRDEMRARLADTFLMSAFDCGPTQLHDYRTGRWLPVDTDIFTDTMKFAEATPEIGYVSTWYRQDVPQPTERITSLVLALQYTTKVDGIEAMYAGAIKYLLDIGEVMGYPRESAPYLAGSQCLISPLTIDDWMGRDMFERRRQGIPRYHIASMPTIGVTTPVTPAGAIVLGAAEILGGMAAAWCLAPGCDLSGRMISTVADMRTADASSAGPENVLVSVGVKRLFDAHFGGHLWTETFFSPSTNRPGLHAVYQNWFAATARARLTDRPDLPYPGMGTLSNGAVGSPAQLMLDLEIRRSQWELRESVEVSDGTTAFDDIRECVLGNDTFLATEHTLVHFRELWNSQIFPLSMPAAAGGAPDERAILERCDERWRDNVRHWEPPDLSEDRRRALEDVVERANRELLS